MGIFQRPLEPNDDGLPYMETVTLKPSFKGWGVFTCSKLFETRTHWIGRRTLPCLTPTCPACDAERPRAYEAFASILWASDKQHQIVRLPQGPVYQLKELLRGTDDWRGVGIEFVRKGKDRNGRIVCRLMERFVESARLPADPDLEAQLMKIFRIDGIRVSDDERAYIIALTRHIEETKLAREKRDGSDTGGAAKTGT